MAEGLTQKQENFCLAYIECGNASEAYRRAYDAENMQPQTIHVKASQLLSGGKIGIRLDELRRAAVERAEINSAMVLRELALIGFANMQDYIQISGEDDPFVDLSRLTREQAAAISEVTVEDFKDSRGQDARDVRRIKFKLLDKRAALTEIGKHLGMFKDRVELTGKDGGPVIEKEPTARERAKAVALILKRGMDAQKAEEAAAGT